MIPENELPDAHPESQSGSQLEPQAHPLHAEAMPEFIPGIVVPALAPAPEPAKTRFLKSILFGPNGVRAGWMVALFIILSFIFLGLIGTITSFIFHKIHPGKLGQFTAGTTIMQEAVSVIAILLAAKICALIARRRVVDYYLTGPKRLIHFVVGSVAGFIALSALVGSLYGGHWLAFGPHALSGADIFTFALLWAIGFFGTGLFEEGAFRCFMLNTLARGINYWWALGTVLVFSGLCAIIPHANGTGGVYLMTGLGLIPCLLLHLRRVPSAGFWQAAWVTSTFFGFIHTSNDGETWIGIFAAAAIGFVFCVSIRLTGSAWWAIGFHGAWDWAQTYFYGTPDSGFQATGHYLTSNPTGAVLWSGGSAGPEGSILVLPIILLTLLALVAAYGRRSRLPDPVPAQQQFAA
jgi:uncharacterized protein